MAGEMTHHGDHSDVRHDVPRDDDADRVAADDVALASEPAADAASNDADVVLPWETGDDGAGEQADTPQLPGVVAHQPDGSVATGAEEDLPLVELTLDRPEDAPDDAAAAAAAALLAESHATELGAEGSGVEAPATDVESLPAAVEATATAGQASESTAPDQPADAYTQVSDALTCRVVQQHLLPEPSAAADTVILAAAAELPENQAAVAHTAIEQEKLSDGEAEAAHSVDGLVFEPPEPDPLAIPALAEVAGDAVAEAVWVGDTEQVRTTQDETVDVTSVSDSPSATAEFAEAVVPAEAPAFTASVEPVEPFSASEVFPRPLAVADHFDIDVDAVHDDPAAEPIPAVAAPTDLVAVGDVEDDETVPAEDIAASAPIMAYADATTPEEDELVDVEADDIDPEPEAVDAAPASGGMWTIPMLCLGIAVIACCVLIPQADYNRRLVYEHEKLRRDADAITEQVKVNDEFLRKVSDDTSLAERLAQRQMKIIRQGTRVLDLKGGGDRDTEMSPYHLVSVPPPDPLPPFQAKGGALTQACLNPHTRLYLIGGALVLMAAGLVLGYAPKRE